MTSLPKQTGISLKAEHYQGLLDTPGTVSWLEVHPENYMGAGGLPHRYLSAIREHYPLSMHGVGLSLGSTDGVNEQHVQRLKKLVDQYQPESVSEHLSWSHWNSHYLNDLLPLPYTHESLSTVLANIEQVQEMLNRQILIENPSTYIDFETSDFSETDFIQEIVQRSGCALLLDINNVFVSGFNNGFDPYRYLDNFPKESVKEIHLAGHSLKPLTEDISIRIDDHGSEVKPEVWALYEHFFALHKQPVATLIEWDTDIPELDILVAQAQKADQHMAEALSNVTQKESQ